MNIDFNTLHLTNLVDQVTLLSIQGRIVFFGRSYNPGCDFYLSIAARLSVSHPMQQSANVWVRDPRIQKNDFWHAYIDYEICLHTNSVSFTRKISRVRRRYSEFVWLRHKLQENSMLMVKLPVLPPKNPFFSLNNAQQIADRMKGLQKFLEQIIQSPLLLSDSCLHLFLQSELKAGQMEACAAGRTRYTAAQVVQHLGSALRRFHSEEDLRRASSHDSDSHIFLDPEPVSTQASEHTAARQPDQEQTLIRFSTPPSEHLPQS